MTAKGFLQNKFILGLKHCKQLYSNCVLTGQFRWHSLAVYGTRTHSVLKRIKGNILYKNNHNHPNIMFLIIQIDNTHTWNSLQKKRGVSMNTHTKVKMFLKSINLACWTSHTCVWQYHWPQLVQLEFSITRPKHAKSNSRNSFLATMHCRVRKVKWVLVYRHSGINRGSNIHTTTIRKHA